jgi:DNA helicase II / ATP-dependent DNA helicase PcrA
MNLLDQEVQMQPEKEWSLFQAAIFSRVEHTDDNVLVEAVAGSGKTTTIVKAMEYIRGAPLFLAFNKSIATEIGNRISRGEARTLNSLGHRIVIQNWPRAQLNSNRVRDAIDKILKGYPYGEPIREVGYAINRSIGLAKANAFGLEGNEPVSPSVLMELMDNYDLGVSSDIMQSAGELAYNIWMDLRRDTETFDFDDQLYLPLYNEWEFPRPDCVFVDEAQDLSPVQHAMLAAMQGTRVIAVGDRFQAIYGFRGASHTSMDELKKAFNMIELPLSISYRCASLIVDEAMKLCPHIRPALSAPTGRVITQEMDDLGNHGDPEFFDNGVLILCRNNAPLFRKILHYIRHRKPCVVLSNFLDSFQGWIRSFKKQYCRDLIPRLDSWYERERDAAIERGAGKSKLMALKDKYETAKMLCEQFSTTEEMLGMLKSLSQGRVGPIFSTIHKAKGLEADRVYLLRPDLVPAPWVEPESDQYKQELNLLYVAITRAKTELTYGVSQP